MRMILPLLAALFLASWFLASCAPPAETSVAKSENIVTNTPSTQESETSCGARGGTLQRVCLMGNTMCVVKYADGGKPCTGKAQCEGQCRLEGPSPLPGARATGVCQLTSDPCGCFTSVEDGKAQATMCVD